MIGKLIMGNEPLTICP